MDVHDGKRANVQTCTHEHTTRAHTTRSTGPAKPDNLYLYMCVCVRRIGANGRACVYIYIYIYVGGTTVMCN